MLAPSQKSLSSQIMLTELMGQDLNINNNKFEGGFSAKTVFPQKTIKDIIPIFKKSDIWEIMFSLVELKFTMPEIVPGIKGQAKAKIEKEAGVYEVSEFKSSDNELVVMVKLSDKDNVNRNINFSQMEAQFRFVQVGSDIQFLVTMLYQRRSYWMLNYLIDKATIDIKSVMRESLKYCIHMAVARVCHPDTFESRKKIRELEVVKTTKEQHKDFVHGLRGSWPIKASVDVLLHRLKTLEAYPLLHERFVVDDGRLSLKLFENRAIPFEVSHDDSSTATVTLSSVHGVFVVNHIQIQFQLEPKDTETKFTIDFNFNTNMFNVGDTFTGTVYQIAEKFIKTALRHMAQEYPASSAVMKAEEERQLVI